MVQVQRDWGAIQYMTQMEKRHQERWKPYVKRSSATASPRRDVAHLNSSDSQRLSPMYTSLPSQNVFMHPSPSTLNQFSLAQATSSNGANSSRYILAPFKRCLKTEPKIQVSMSCPSVGATYLDQDTIAHRSRHSSLPPSCNDEPQASNGRASLPPLKIPSKNSGSFGQTTSTHLSSPHASSPHPSASPQLPPLAPVHLAPHDSHVSMSSHIGLSEFSVLQSNRRTNVMARLRSMVSTRLKEKHRNTDESEP